MGSGAQGEECAPEGVECGGDVVGSRVQRFWFLVSGFGVRSGFGGRVHRVWSSWFLVSGFGFDHT